MKLIDSHAHLTDEAYTQDLEAVLKRAQDAGVEHIITLGTDVESSRACVALAEKYTAVWSAVGIHPEKVGEAKLDDVQMIHELASHPRVVAIGEIGLDYYWDRTSAERQQVFFEKQLELAAELDLPASIHDRDAHQEILRIWRKFENMKLRGVLHAFSGDSNMAREALDLGLSISFAGPVTFLNWKMAPDLVPLVPLESMLIETDSPYLTPHPLRGRRNEPAYVGRIAERIAHLTGLSAEQVADATTRNAHALFGF